MEEKIPICKKCGTQNTWVGSHWGERAYYCSPCGEGNIDPVGCLMFMGVVAVVASLLTFLSQLK